GNGHGTGHGKGSEWMKGGPGGGQLNRAAANQNGRRPTIYRPAGGPAWPARNRHGRSCVAAVADLPSSVPTDRERLYGGGPAALRRLPASPPVPPWPLYGHDRPSARTIIRDPAGRKKPPKVGCPTFGGRFAVGPRRPGKPAAA